MPALPAPNPSRTARCTSCGAVVDLPPDVLSTTCRFCDSPLVDQPADGVPVDAIVPFVVPRERAAERLLETLHGRFFAPRALRQASSPAELRPVFVPLWSWDATTRSRWSAEVGVEWQRVETYTTTENGKTVTRTRTVTEVEWFDLDGAHVAAFADHLVSGSRGLSEDEANALEPFDVGRAEPWAPERVAGIVAERPTIARDDAVTTARAELTALTERAIERFLPGDRHRALDARVEVDVQGVRLVLAPVWIAAFGLGERTVRLLVNGQTGEVVGETPVDPWRVALVVGAVLLVLAALALVAGALGGAS